MRRRSMLIEPAVGLLALVGLVLAIGWVGLSQMADLNANVDRFAHRRATAVAARDAMAYSNVNNRITMEMVLLRDQAQMSPLLTERAANAARITDRLAVLRTRARSVHEQALLDDIVERRKPYVESYTKALHLLLTDRDVEAARLVMIGETLSYPTGYHEAWQRFVQSQEELMSAAERSSGDAHDAARRRGWTPTRDELDVPCDPFERLGTESRLDAAGAAWRTLSAETAALMLALRRLDDAHSNEVSA